VNTRILFFLFVITLLQSCESIDDKIFLCDKKDTYAFDVGYFSPSIINVYRDYEKGLACAKENDCLTLIHFTWYGSSTHKFEDKVLLNRTVQKFLREDFLLIQVYVDNPKELPKEEQEWIDFNDKKKHIRTYGHKNTQLQISMFNHNSQPLFVILNSNGEQISEPWGYIKDPNIFIKKMENALVKINQ
jgi:thioredoxin-related protein